MAANLAEVKAKTEKESKALQAALKKRKQERLKSSPKRRRIEGVTYLRADYVAELLGRKNPA